MYTGEDVVAFLDIRPLTPGHLLVIPRAHADRLEILAPDLGARVFTVAQQLAVALRRSGFCAGTNLFLADGVLAGQEVFHVHLHVIPRNQRDGFGLRAKRHASPSGANSTPPPSRSGHAFRRPRDNPDSFTLDRGGH